MNEAGKNPKIENTGKNMHKILNVLHIDTEKTWRGGENQMRLLIQGSQSSTKSFLATPPDSIAAQKLKGSATIIPLNLRGASILKSSYTLASFCRSNSIDLIDCQTSKAHDIALLIKFFYPNVKIVVHRRVDFKPGASWINRKKYLSPSIDAFIPISNAIGEILINYGIPAEKIHTVRSAVDPSPFKNGKVEKAKAKEGICNDLGIDANLPLIANVAYHTPQKGMETLIKGLNLLSLEGKPFNCVLAGEGNLTPKLKELVRNLGLEKRVHFLGIRDDVPEILAAADIFTLPSNYEGLGTSILDAIHSNCAVAASNVGGIPEMIHHEYSGLLSEVGDFKGLSTNLSKLVANIELRERFCRNASIIAKQNFSIESMVEGNLETYRKILS